MAEESKIIQRDDQGRLYSDKPIRGWDSYYQDAVIRYMNLWEDLFEKAQERNEFEFILALLRVRGIEDAGWDTFDNTLEGIEGAYTAAKVLRGVQRLNIMLWAYGQVVEASDHYEIIANMVRIAGGESYAGWNFPKKKAPTKKDPAGMRSQTPNEKILVIRALCKRLNLDDYSSPFTEVLDKTLRNAIYHSDYSVHEGKVRIREGKNGFPYEYSEDDTRKLLNYALALHEVIKQLYHGFIASYTEPKVIDVSPAFNHGQPMKAQVIVRDNHGVMAMQEHPYRPGSFSLGRYVPGEMEKISAGIYQLPESASVRINNILDKLHRYKARRWGIFIRAFQRGGGGVVSDPTAYIKTARKLLGSEAEDVTDKQLIRMLDDLENVADYLVSKYGNDDSNKD